MGLLHLLAILTVLAMAGAVSSEANSPAQREAGPEYHHMRSDMVERYYGTVDSDGSGAENYRVPGTCKLIDDPLEREVQIALMDADIWKIRREVEVYKEQGSKVLISPCKPVHLSL